MNREMERSRSVQAITPWLDRDEGIFKGDASGSQILQHVADSRCHLWNRNLAQGDQAEVPLRHFESDSQVLRHQHHAMNFRVADDLTVISSGHAQAAHMAGLIPQGHQFVSNLRWDVLINQQVHRLGQDPNTDIFEHVRRIGESLFYLFRLDLIGPSHLFYAPQVNQGPDHRPNRYTRSLQHRSTGDQVRPSFNARGNLLSCLMHRFHFQFQRICRLNSTNGSTLGPYLATECRR